MLFAETKNSNLSEDMIQKEMKAVGEKLLKNQQQERAKELMHQIKKAQSASDSETEAKLFQEYSRLISL